MAKIVFILGGARSGKSDFAQRLAGEIGGNDVLYVATAEPLDDEMKQRIAMHQQSRPKDWELLEVPVGVGHAMSNAKRDYTAIVIDCLTLLVSNVMTADVEEPVTASADDRVAQEMSELLAACRQLNGIVIVVSNEVGLGIVPNSALGRRYRDLLGRANQQVVEQADTTYFMVAGRPLELNQTLSIERIAESLNAGE